jgi:protein TonB
MRSDYRARPSIAKALLLGGGLLLGLTLLWVLVSWLRADAEVQPRRTVQVTVLRPPPPPPPRKLEEKPPEPPKVREEIKIDTPRPVDEPKVADEAPAPGPLGLDAPGSGPGDGFGLAARPGGRDITLGGGGGGLGFSMFANGAARHIAQELARVEQLRHVEYRVEVRVWIAKDGRIERAEMAGSSGDARTDALIREGLSRMTALRGPVPEGLPQPLRVRVTSSET